MKNIVGISLEGWGALDTNDESCAKKWANIFEIHTTLYNYNCKVSLLMPTNSVFELIPGK